MAQSFELLIYSLLILFLMTILRLKKLHYLESYRSLFTIIAGIIAIILFDVAAPISDWEKILFTFGVIAAIAFLAISERHPKHQKDKVQTIIESQDEPLIGPTEKMGWSEIMPSELDPKFSHVYAVFFYPKQVSWQKGERNPHLMWTRFKVVVNTKTNRAFWMAEYASDLFKKRKIQKVTADGETEQDMIDYLKKKGITLIERPASESDLLDK